MLCSFFWVIPLDLNFLRQHFGTPYIFHLRRSFKQEE